MAKKRGNTVVYNYIERAESHLEYLFQTGKLKNKTRGSFFTDFLGCGEFCYKNWFSTGIRKVYLTVLFLLEEIKKHQERIKMLEEQLKELTKK